MFPVFLYISQRKKKCFGATKFNQESVDNYIFRIYGYSQQELNIKLNLHSIKAFGSLFFYICCT